LDLGGFCQIALNAIMLNKKLSSIQHTNHWEHGLINMSTSLYLVYGWDLGEITVGTDNTHPINIA